MLGYLQKVAAKGRAGLILWLVCRSMSIVMLLVGGVFRVHIIPNSPMDIARDSILVYRFWCTVSDMSIYLVLIKSIYVALFGRIFEGLASDNLLHFMLNSVYSRSTSKAKASSLIMGSLAVYILGISISPFIPGLFRNFVVSFFMALGLFATSIIYSLDCVPGPARLEGQSTSTAAQDNSAPAVLQEVQGVSVSSLGMTFLAPLRPFQQQPTYVFIGLSLLTYNIIRSYIFSALMVHTSVCFGFTGKENGFLISMVHSVAAFYIFANIYVPRCIPWWQRRRARDGLTPLSMGSFQSHSRARDMCLAVTPLAIQGVALVGLGPASQGKQVFISSRFCLRSDFQHLLSSRPFLSVSSKMKKSPWPLLPWQ